MCFVPTSFDYSKFVKVWRIFVRKQYAIYPSEESHVIILHIELDVASGNTELIMKYVVTSKFQTHACVQYQVPHRRHTRIRVTKQTLLWFGNYAPWHKDIISPILIKVGLIAFHRILGAWLAHLHMILLKLCVRYTYGTIKHPIPSDEIWYKYIYENNLFLHTSFDSLQFVTTHFVAKISIWNALVFLRVYVVSIIVLLTYYC